MRDLTILITTMDRKHYLDSLLYYYSERSYPGSILIGDSSEVPYCIPKGLFLNVEILYRRNISQSDLFVELVRLCKTDYVLYSGDDDYLIDWSLLDRHQQFINPGGVLNLLYWTLDLDSTNFPTSINMPFISADLMSEDLGKRPKDLLFARCYRSLMFSITTKTIWEMAIRAANKYATKSVSSEIGIGAHLLNFSTNFAVTDSISLIRLQHPGQYSLPEPNEAILERVKLGLEILGDDTLDFRLGLLYRNTPDRIALRKSIIDYGTWGDSSTMSKTADVFSCVNRLYAESDKLLVVYWGNKSVLSILVQLTADFIQRGYRVVIFLSNEHEYDDSARSLITSIGPDLIGYSFVSPWLHATDIDIIELMASGNRKTRSVTVLSISAILPFEMYLINRLIPDQVVLVWPHMSNLLNYPQYSLDVLNYGSPRWTSFLNTIFFRDTLKLFTLGLIIRTNRLLFYSCTALIQSFQNETFRSVVRKCRVPLTSKMWPVKRVKNYLFSAAVKDSLRRKFATHVTRWLMLRVLLLMLLRCRGIISTFFKPKDGGAGRSRSFSLFFTSPDVVASGKFMSGSLVDKMLRYKLDPITMYLYFSKGSLSLFSTYESLFPTTIRQLFSDERLANVISQIGCPKGIPTVIKGVTNLECEILRRIYPNAKVEELCFEGHRIGVSADHGFRTGLLTISVGLLPSSKSAEEKLLVELDLFINTWSLNRILFRPHPLMAQSEILAFSDFLTESLAVEVLVDGGELKSSLASSIALLTTISGVITEIDKKDHPKISLLYSLSSQQYKQISLFKRFYPTIS